MKTSLDQQIFNIATVSFLNARPLTETVPKNQVQTAVAYPKECLEMLLKRKVDCALIPSITLAENPQLKLLPASCIASRGKIGSVILAANKPLAQIGSIAVDERSTTSFALLRILCAEIFQIKPEFIAYFPHRGKISASEDATLMIGDEALWAKPTRYVWDLGALWNEWKALPFVYAVWATHENQNDEVLLKILLKSKEAGIKKIKTLSQEYPRHQEKVFQYLSNQVSYDMNPETLKGLNTFFYYAFKHKIIPQPFTVGLNNETYLR